MCHAQSHAEHRCRYETFKSKQTNQNNLNSGQKNRQSAGDQHQMLGRRDRNRYSKTGHNRSNPNRRVRSARNTHTQLWQTILLCKVQDDHHTMLITGHFPNSVIIYNVLIRIFLFCVTILFGAARWCSTVASQQEDPRFIQMRSTGSSKFPISMNESVNSYWPWDGLMYTLPYI